MAFIVFNKRTGRYLRRHSGSYSNFRGKATFYDNIYNEIKEQLGPAPSRKDDEEAYKEYCTKHRELAEKLIFNAEPGDARVYATQGSALTSVGNWVKKQDRKYGDPFGHYTMPDHLELHEIKESFICVMRPDGSSNCDEDEED